MTYRFHPEARLEYLGAVDRYLAIRGDLARDFVAEFERGLAHILEHPDACPVVQRDARRCILRRFPFAIIYRVEADTLFIVAVMHQKRRPRYWRRRLTDA